MPALAYPAGENMSFNNASVGVYTYMPLSASDLAYPQDLWYLLLVIAAGAMLFTIWFLTREKKPPVALLFSTTASWSLFGILAFMAPATAKMSTVVTSTQVINVVTYVFSPWVSIVMWGMCLMNLALMFYAFILLFKQVGELKEKVAREKEEAYFRDII
jgi:hypothetical protein